MYRPYSRMEEFTPSASLHSQPRHYSPHEEPADEDERNNPERLPAERGHPIPAAEWPL